MKEFKIFLFAVTYVLVLNSMIIGADIHEAAKRGDLEEVKALVAKGENVNLKDDRDLTPLYYAAEIGHKNICEFLITKGADVNEAPAPFYTPLYAAFNNRSKEGEETFKFLVEHGSDFKIVVGGYTLLHNAAYSCHDESQRNIAVYLISKGIDVNVPGYNDKTPLHMVGCKKICELLLSQGADIEAKDKTGRTPLFYASSNNKTEVCELLLSEGADVNAKDNSGRTPLSEAIEISNKEIIDILKKYGGVE